MLMFKPREEIINKPADQTGKYSIYLKSNRPKSAEVIRIASNRNGVEAVLKDDASPDGTYAGNAYRSVTFELANYNRSVSAPDWIMPTRLEGCGTGS